MSNEKKVINVGTTCDCTPLEAWGQIVNMIANLPVPASQGVQLMALIEKAGEIFNPPVQTMNADIPTEDPIDGDGVPHQPGNPKP